MCVTQSFAAKCLARNERNILQYARKNAQYRAKKKGAHFRMRFAAKHNAKFFRCFLHA